MTKVAFLPRNPKKNYDKYDVQTTETDMERLIQQDSNNPVLHIPPDNFWVTTLPTQHVQLHKKHI